MWVVEILVDVQDAMGANAINSMCERLAPRIEEITGGRVNLRILSNLSDLRTVRAVGRVPVERFAPSDPEAARVLASRIVEASVFAERDPYRATTHNKGIMNGVDAVLLAFGQDTRAVEAGAHAYAARGGRYTALSRFRVEDDTLFCELTLPMAVGTVGGVAKAHPTVAVARQMAGISRAGELASIATAVGLAQNLAALKALAGEGIQSGHMRLHARKSTRPPAANEKTARRAS
jgi:hydroxymethylglutaryl-CoA reductase